MKLRYQENLIFFKFFIIKLCILLLNINSILKIDSFDVYLAQKSREGWGAYLAKFAIIAPFPFPYFLGYINITNVRRIVF